MGNVIGFNIDLGCGSLIQFCCTPSGVPVRRSINDLRNNLHFLVASKSQLERRIQESHGMRPLEQAIQWLLQAETLEAKAQNLINDYTNYSTIKCFGVRCTKNCKSRFDLWKKIAPVDKEVTDLRQQQPTEVFEPVSIALPQRVPTEPTTGMVELMLDEVWSRVQDEQVAGMIGIYGMGGVGKTTLLKAVNNKLCSSAKIFDLQLWIVVSKTPNLVGIQNDIGKNIGLNGAEWISKSRDEKARDIVNILEKKRCVLLLDDIWERFDLLNIGVPLPNSTNKSKVIFTTRSKQVCGQMKANNPIPVKCLNEAEAWALFKENVGEEALNAHHDVPDLAKDVMKECDGLPLALIVIGRAMACKTSIHEWKHAIDALKENAAKLSTSIHDEVFGRLKYSYDNLSDDSIRSCFLYCSLYPEDDQIYKDNLIDKWLCEDFYDQSDYLDKDRRQGYVNISTLVKASLLEECSEGTVKMHDVIRDMAIWIGGDCGKKQDKFIVKARAGLTKMPDDVNWKHAERLSLMSNDIGEPNPLPECPNLMTLFLGEAKLRSINNGFFEFMPKLCVLDLSNNSSLSSLPIDIGKLVSLRYLNVKLTPLRNLPKEIGNLVSLQYLNVALTQLYSLPEDIGKLVSLQYLNISYTKVSELPEELKELIKLKYLNMWDSSIFSIPEEVVSSLKELRTLICEDIFGLGDSYTTTELESLKYLNEVAMKITTEVGILKLSSINLRTCLKNLSICDLDGLICLDLGFLEKLKNLERFFIFKMRTVEKIEVGKHGTIINCIRFLSVSDCNQLMDLSWVEFAPNIEKIFVENCEEMKTLVAESRWNENTRVGGIPFSKLTSLCLEELPNLESIYPTNLSLPGLKELKIIKCNKLKKLPFHYVTGRMIEIEGQQSWWDTLEWEDDITRIAFSKCFKVTSDPSDDRWSNYFF